MKRNLLITLALSTAIAANAQDGMPVTVQLQAVPSGTKITKVHSPTPMRAGVNTTFTAGCEATLGSSANSFTAINGPRSNVYYSPDINTISFIHRGDPANGVGANSGDYFWDISTDGGSTWNINQGPSYAVSGSPGNLARYPMGVIYNPTGNTDPANAWVAGFGACTGGSGWLSQAHCTSKLDGSNANQEVEAFVANGFMGYIPSTMENDQAGNVYVADFQTDVVGGPGFGNTNLNLTKGIWNAGANKYDYTHTYLPFTADLDPNDGTPIFRNDVQSYWSADGLTGYMVTLSHVNDPNFAASQNGYFPCIIKTTDGGATWGNPYMVSFNNLDALFGTPDTGYVWSFVYDVDMTLDNQNNLHIVGAIHMLDMVAGQYLIGPGSFGIADVYTTDGGTTWFAKFLTTTQTYMAVFDDNAGGTVGERLRTSVTKNASGTKLFYTYFDTDTITNPYDPSTTTAAQANTLPDAWCIGYDLTTNMQTPLMNLTAGSLAESSCLIANVSNVVVTNGTTTNIPITYQELSNGTAGTPSVGTPCIHHYVCGQVDDAAFTEAVDPGNIVQLTTVTAVKNIDRVDVGVAYPNPTSDMLNIPANFITSSNVSVDVTNIIGQTVATFNFGKLSGYQTLKLDVSSLSSGTYLYTIKTDGNRLTRLFVVK
ncbi:MAG: T9SS type A sorting domain-containing protein [Bacteroidetes bacterium]|nr:hypothetical protein [Bacteroidia bacterium]MCB0849809.1 T9SS type A sorting domain-containing protein [Bacteroidota bacterium]MCE7955531.1 T9SS C-terminal target domain-containing protein [Bacteroidetes bacterium CHB6]MCO5287935.1 T9SS type A sorting domain-containing protein [Bacteroidota bacterium]